MIVLYGCGMVSRAHTSQNWETIPIGLTVLHFHSMVLVWHQVPLIGPYGFRMQSRVHKLQRWEEVLIGLTPLCFPLTAVLWGGGAHGCRDLDMGFDLPASSSPSLSATCGGLCIHYEPNSTHLDSSRPVDYSDATPRPSRPTYLLHSSTLFDL